MELLFVFQKEKTLDIDFERAKELIDEKAIADAPVAFYKGEVQKSVGRFLWMDSLYKCK
jgi:hypothetical protein